MAEKIAVLTNTFKIRFRLQKSMKMSQHFWDLRWIQRQIVPCADETSIEVKYKLTIIDGKRMKLLNYSRR